MMKLKMLPLTPEQFAERMQVISENRDEEVSHGDADKLMCELLRALGYYRGVEIFEQMDKSYA